MRINKELGQLATHILSSARFCFIAQPLLIASVDLRQAFYVSVANDGVTEGVETLLASLSNASAMTIMGGSATISIRNANAGVPQLLVGNICSQEAFNCNGNRLALAWAANDNAPWGLRRAG